MQYLNVILSILSGPLLFMCLSACLCVSVCLPVCVCLSVRLSVCVCDVIYTEEPVPSKIKSCTNSSSRGNEKEDNVCRDGNAKEVSVSVCVSGPSLSLHHNLNIFHSINCNNI